MYHAPLVEIVLLRMILKRVMSSVGVSQSPGQLMRSLPAVSLIHAFT
jgi:hypothetical protein